ncbi:MAG: hypothetical protein H6Q78_612 [Candidatus Krumholzibacteriota bacterium]|nr:hypothetical protein [Candidatus Krumholzibacteriota bacterium]
MKNFGMTWVSVVILMASAVLAPAFSQCPERTIQADPVHLGDTDNPDWYNCSPMTPASPYGVCYDLFINVTVEEAGALNMLRMTCGGASTPTILKVYLDSVFLGYVPEANAGRCNWNVGHMPIPLTSGFHNIRFCTSIYNYQTGSEYDDLAFYDVRLTCSVPVPAESATWGHIKTIYQ